VKAWSARIVPSLSLSITFWFLGNKTEEEFAVKGVVKRSDRELIATVLALKIGDSKRAKVLLLEEYTKFYTQYYSYI
jgi:hypothetical protein